MKDPRLGQLIAEVKAREFEGWSFDRAEASFELLVKRVLKQVSLSLSLSHTHTHTHTASLYIRVLKQVPFFLKSLHRA